MRAVDLETVPKYASDAPAARVGWYSRKGVAHLRSQLKTTQMIDLQHFRNRAKRFVRWHRNGYYPVAATIRAFLPKFRELNDPGIMSSRFKLADAQELVARSVGFESWSALRKGNSHMPELKSSEQTSAKLVAAEPQLFVTDIERAIQFFDDRLGFGLNFTYGEPPFYAQVARDGVCLNLRHVDMPVFDPAFRRSEPDALAATIVLEKAKPLFLEFQDRGVEFHQRLRAEPWGAETFIVSDPDGNLIAFAGR